MTYQSGSDGGLNATPAVAVSPLSSAHHRFPSQIGRITAIQSRMARAALDRTQGDIATGTGCSIRTIVSFENDSDSVSRKNANVIRRYYESLGIRFIGDAYHHAVSAPK